MTLKEIKLIIDNYIKTKQDDVKLDKIRTYNQAFLSSLFIGKMLGGKSIPPIEQIFPDVIEMPQEEKHDNQMDNNLIIIKERMIDFANEANKRRNKQEELTCQRF